MKIKTLALGAKAETYTFPKGAILNDLFEKWRYPKREETVFINKSRVSDFNTPLKK